MGRHDFEAAAVQAVVAERKSRALVNGWIIVDHGKQVIVLRKRVQGFKLHPNFDLVLTQVSLQ